MSIAGPEGTDISSGGAASPPGEAGYTGVAPAWRGGAIFAIVIHAAVAGGFVAWQFGQTPPPETAAANT
ncbi:hypothetical protein, partial [Parvibaculum sp.]|uniref:hypothetical protein n=1 Tax=Parvibaculum sp. TaxID=2024848 RepID=UPI00329721C6